MAQIRHTNQIKLILKKSSSALQQLIKWIKFIKWDWQYYSRGRFNFQEKPYSRFTRSIQADWLSDKQETKRPKETQFSWKKKYYKTGKMDSLWTPRNITLLEGSCYEAVDSSISQIFSHTSKCLASSVEKTKPLKITKKDEYS